MADKKETVYDPFNPDAEKGGHAVDLTGPGFPPMPTEPAKPHTEEEVNKLGLTIGDSVVSSEHLESEKNK